MAKIVSVVLLSLIVVNVLASLVPAIFHIIWILVILVVAGGVVVHLVTRKSGGGAGDQPKAG